MARKVLNVKRRDLTKVDLLVVRFATETTRM
jgi:hypothetical protein